MAALERNNANVGAGYIERGGAPLLPELAFDVRGERHN
ncbi:hypothetical protein PSYJA_45476, partial [Pseudomonas syringae pv. japonica str. M301072]